MLSAVADRLLHIVYLPAVVVPSVYLHACRCLSVCLLVSFPLSICLLAVVCLSAYLLACLVPYICLLATVYLPAYLSTVACS